MLEQTGERRVEGSVASPKTGKGQNTLTSQLLNQSSLREDNTEHVTEGGQRNEHRQSTLSLVAIHVSEQRCGNESLGFKHLLLGHTGEVRDVGEHVKDRNGAQSQGSSELERSGRVLGLAQSVVGVGVADVTPDDVIQGGDNAVRASSGSFKRVVEAVVFADLLQVGQRSHNDQDNDEDLQDTKEVLQSNTPFQSSTVDEKGGGQASQGNTTLVPAGDFNLRGMKDVLAKYDGVTSGPAKKDDIARVEAGGQELGLSVDKLKVVLFTAVARQAGSEFHVYSSSSGGDNGTNQPQEHGQANTSRERENGSGGREDTSSDDSVEDEE